jgi:ABC-type uncharacterized transport system substrate-binding protein
VGSAVACPLSVRAQPTVKVYRVGLVFSGGRDFWELDSNVPNAEALSEGLRDLGYVQGHNLALSWRSAEGKGNKRAAEIGTELIQNGIDVIVVDMGSSTVPILMTASLDPVAQGVATNLARPGGNVTGISVQAGPQFDTKRMQLLKDSVPNLSRVAFLGIQGAGRVRTEELYARRRSHKD